jgi:hypothetical protein
VPRNRHGQPQPWRHRRSSIRHTGQALIVQQHATLCAIHSPGSDKSGLYCGFSSGPSISLARGLTNHIYLLLLGGNQYCAQAASSQRVPSARSQGDFAGAMGLRWHLRWNGASDAALHVCVIADLVHENERRVACFSALRKQASFQEDGFVVQCF